MSVAVAWQGVVPAIPAARLDPVAEDDGVLIWVRHGRVTVAAGTASYVASAGEAVWLPPGTRHSARLDPGSVALPVLAEIRDVPPVLARPCVVVVPAAWADWLVYRVARWFGFTSGVRPDRTHLLDLLVGVAPDRPAGGAPDAPSLPPLPRSPGPRSVVEHLIRRPASTASLAELAAEAAASPRTLQRQLREETGLSLARWRASVRIVAAAGHLARGRDLGWTAHEVGYASVSGFVHAFTARVGTSPGRYAEHHRAARRRAGEDVLLSGASAGAVPLGTAPDLPPPPAIPAVPASTWVQPFDSVLWVFRGAVVVEVAGRRRELGAGDVVWLPQGVPYQLEIAAGSILLPLGWKTAGRPVGTTSLPVLRMPRSPEVELFLLHTVVSNHFLLRPPGHDEHAFLDVLHPSYPVPEVLPAHLETVVSAVVDDPAEPRSLADWARELGTDPERLRRDFVDVLGESYPAWRAKVRMTEARHLLWDGHPPSVAARRLGYGHLSTFSKAFTAAHGMPPREWLRRDAG